jgi:hypothetical protein
MQKNHDPSDPSNVTFNVLSPGTFFSKAIARRRDRCRILSTLFPNTKMIFIYNGEVLNENFSFESYEIQNAEIVVAIPEIASTSQQSFRWIQISRDSEAFSSIINSMMNCSTHRESMRLRDIVLMKKEMSRRRCPEMFSSPASSAFARVSQCKTDITEKADEISTDPLPVVW